MVKMTTGQHEDMQVAPSKKLSPYLQVLRNRNFTLLWSGSTISSIGDVFFDLTAIWVIYAESHSVLQTAFIQVIWHLDRILIGPFTGILADRWDRKHIMLLTNILSALVVGGLAAIFPLHGHLSPWLLFIAIFVLNSLNSFLGNANFSIMPEIVNKELLATSSGLSAASGQTAFFIGNLLAGIVLAGGGTMWALLIDAFTFLYAAVSITLARLPKREVVKQNTVEPTPSLWQDFTDGWKVLTSQSVVKGIVIVIVLLNVASFTGPLWPALIIQRLHGTAADLGTIEAVSVIGSVLGGLLAGPLERKCGTGFLLVGGYTLAGLSTIGIAFSTFLIVTCSMGIIFAFSMTAAGVAFGVLIQMLIPETHRGRVSGLIQALSVSAIPVSALLGGWLTDIFGVVPLFAFSGFWIIGVAILAAANRHIRTACI